MRLDKLVLSCLIAGGAIGSFILLNVFSPKEGREFNYLINQCKETLGKVEEILKET